MVNIHLGIPQFGECVNNESKDDIQPYRSDEEEEAEIDECLE